MSVEVLVQVLAIVQLCCPYRQIYGAGVFFAGVRNREQSVLPVQMGFSRDTGNGPLGHRPADASTTPNQVHTALEHHKLFAQVIASATYRIIMQNV